MSPHNTKTVDTFEPPHSERGVRLNTYIKGITVILHFLSIITLNDFGKIS